ncbi:MAG: T9SS type A sorting domain-containing protein, partial [Bacteroidetes bacterium]|nr:T9SS type A sorting domain-containing protein [Bacteroidota bacterium]
VKWADKSNNETSFEVYMSAGNRSNYRKVGATGANKTHYTVSNLSNGQTYYLKVRAINKEDNSSFSNEVMVKNSSTSTATATASTTSSRQKVMVNFNLGQNAGAPWNNFDQDPDTNSKLTNLLDESGNSTAISLELLTPWGYESGWNGYGDQGVKTGNNSGVVPDEVMQTYFWSSRTQAEVVKVSGLDAKTTYNFSFMGSKSGSGDRTTLFSINGTTVSLNAAANSKGIVTIKNVQPDSKGELTIKVQKASTASFAYLNAMIIEAAGASQPANNSELADAQLLEGSKQLSLTEVTAYPNPATDFVDVRFGSDFDGDVQVQLLDLSGKVILSQQVQASPEAFTRLDLTGQQLKAGMYVIRIDNGMHHKTVKLLKN